MGKAIGISRQGPKARDALFCARCKFSAQPTLRRHYLCDFLLINGTPRGCPPGAGCRKRILREASGQKKP